MESMKQMAPVAGLEAVEYYSAPEVIHHNYLRYSANEVPPPPPPQAQEKPPSIAGLKRGAFWLVIFSTTVIALGLGLGIGLGLGFQTHATQNTG